jgi:RHS repeat-associated protein
MLVLQERDQNNIPQVTYTRGVDLSGGLQRAGGIGGLLARTEPLAFSLQPSYFHADAVGNITALIDTNQTVDARYHYDPYGNLLGLSGSMAEANLYRFSSKEFHPNSGLYYYGYRLYAPGLQRWVNRDPIGEFGGCNLYCYVRNRPLQFFDPFGFSWYDDVADWWAEQVALSQDYLDANAPWWLAGTGDTVLDIGLGLASTPQAFGHLGEGTGTFSAEPTLEHAAGLAQDVSLIAGTLVGCKLKATECVDHHSIPRGTLKKLPKPVREHPDVRGRKGNPNIRRVPKDWHDKVHSSPPGQYYPGGEYNRRFDLMIEEGRGYRTVTPEEVIEIRDQLMSDFQP